MTFNDVTRSQKTLSGALALATHVLFFVLLVFGVSWQQQRPDSAMIVDLWSNLPPLPQPKVETPPPPEVKPAPEPPKPAPEVEAKPPPKPEPKPLPKPDIALKEKLEKERKLKEQLEARKREEEKKREADKKRLAVLKEKLAKEEADRREKELQDAIRKVQEQQAAQAAALSRSLAEYSRLVSDRIRRFVVLPPGMQGNPQAEFDVVQIPGGEVLSVKLKRSSGVGAYDSAVERAILKAQPLPPPPAPLTFRDVRELNLKFRPKE